MTVLTAGPGQAQRKESDIQFHYKRAEEALQERRYDEASEEFRAILQIDPTVAEAHANLGVIAYEQGHFQDASASLGKALEIKPSLTHAALLLGLCQSRSGNLDDALPALEKGFRNAPNDEWRLQAGLRLVEIYYAREDVGRALEVVGDLRKGYPDSADVLYISYRLHSDSAARAISSLVRVAPESARLHQVTAELLETEGDFPGAVRQYREALKRNQSLTGANRALGVALMNTDGDSAANQQEAHEAFERELGLNPRDAECEYQLGEIAWRRHQPDEALRRFSRAVEQQPRFTEALIALAKVWTAKGEPLKATQYLEQAVNINPDDDSARYRLAQAYRQAGRIEDASKQLQEFQRLRSALESLGAIYRQVQRRTAIGRTEDVGDQP